MGGVPVFLLVLALTLGVLPLYTGMSNPDSDCLLL